MEALKSEVESDCSETSSIGYSRIKDEPGLGLDGETIVVSDGSVYSITNEDFEDVDDVEEMEWNIKEEEAVLSIKEEQVSADEGIDPLGNLDGEVLSVKEEDLSDVSDLPGTNGSPAQCREGLASDFTESEEEEGGGNDGVGYEGVQVKVEDFFTLWDAPVTSPARSEIAISPLRCTPIKRVKKPKRKPLSTKRFHCYYCPQLFRMKAYLPRHVRQHLENGDRKFEVEGPNGESVHPAYIQGTVSPVRQNPRNQERAWKPWRGRTWNIYHCYYCPVFFNLKASLSAHVLAHLAKGDPKFETPDEFGKMVHPSLIENQPVSKKPDEIHSCHLCGFKTKHVNVLRSHLKRHARQALDPQCFTCYHCSWKTHKRHYLNLHMRRHLPKEYNCEFCSYKALTARTLKIHLRLHTGELPFTCDICSEQFMTKGYLQRHFTKHKPRTQVCPHCTFATAKGSDMSNHILSVHLGDRKYGCPKCRYKTKDVPSLRSHMRSIHRMKLDYVKCRYCDFEVSRNTSMKLHEHTHVAPWGYTCDECAYSTKNKNQLILHSKIHTLDKPFACSLCDYRSKCRKSVTRHMVVHSDDRQFKCGQCNQYFKTAQSAQSHEVYAHKLVTMRFECQYCEYKAFHKKSLAEHELCHTAEKTFKCLECDYMARTDLCLKTHMRAHARGGDHKCDYCNFRSVNSMGVATHILAVHPDAKPYACGYCSAAFKYKAELADHEREHTGEEKRPRRKGLVYRRLSCRYCNFQTIPFKKLKQHYEENHPDILETEVIPEFVDRQAQETAERQRKPKTRRKCRFCNFETTIRKRMRLHEENHQKFDLIKIEPGM